MIQAFHAIEQTLGASLAYLYDLVPSLGVAIILLTIGLNLVLFPLTLKQTRATRAFQEIQPEIKRIQKELKDKPEEMQKELMRVQRSAGATPGGCLLPMLVQLPIWWALFRVLRDLAGSLPAGSKLLDAVQSGPLHFLGMEMSTNMSTGVLGGLPRAIPYALMLIIMVATQYIQQWHATRGQGTGADGKQQQQQTQQALTRIMPLFIGLISWNFPTGLVVYWTTSNIFRLGQQVLIFRLDGRPQAPAPALPAVEGNGEAARQARPQTGSAKKRRRRRRK